MIRTVLFLVSAPFGKRDYHRYGIEIFKANGFDVRVWDLTPFLFPDVYKSLTISDPIDWDQMTVFQTEADFVAALNEHSTDTFIFNTEVYNYNTFPIYRAMSQRRIRYCVGVLNPGPVLQLDSPQAVRQRLSKITPKKVLTYLFRQIPPRCFNIRSATMVLALGSKCSIRRRDVSSATRIVYGHPDDYDVYLQLGRDGVVSGNTAVFLDNYLAFHPDKLYAGDTSLVTPNRYYGALNDFLNSFELQSGLRVVVAAHPRSRYERLPELFGEREVVRGRTAELVKTAGLVITTFSASVNFAVLFRKPCVFLTTDELEESTYGPYVHQCAGEFGKCAINIDKPVDVDLAEALRVDEVAYARYQHAYIKTEGSEELPGWQILCNRIKEL